MKKRVLSLLLALVLMIGLIPVTANADQYYNDMVYEVVDNHVVITNYVGTATQLAIPEKINGLPVTVIDDYAFFYSSDLVKITLPKTVNYIGDRAFAYCAKLESITIPNAVTAINEGTFRECVKLKTVTLPSNLVSIGNSAFRTCTSLTSIQLPDSLVSIGTSSFEGCDKLSSINLPAGITSIGIYAFSGCRSLTSICFRGNAPTFGTSAFYEVTATAYYPAANSTWSQSVMNPYGGNITWVSYVPTPFKDVTIGSFYEAPVLWAVENGITAGTSANTFSPDDLCLRAHVVTFLHRAAKNPEPSSIRNPFNDVKPSDFFYKPVLWAVEKGITNGTSANTFGSHNNCNRAAVVTFLWRAAGSPEPASTTNPFTDVNSGHFFYKPVLWAVEKGITNGVDATHFGPSANCNRAQVVTFLYRAYH